MYVKYRKINMFQMDVWIHGINILSLKSAIVCAKSITKANNNRYVSNGHTDVLVLIIELRNFLQNTKLLKKLEIC